MRAPRHAVPVVGARCGTSRVLSRQYVRDQRRTAETTELGGVEGQWQAQRGGGDYRGAHAPTTGAPAAHRSHPHVPRRHGVFSQSQRELKPSLLKILTPLQVKENNLLTFTTVYNGRV